VAPSRRNLVRALVLALVATGIGLTACGRRGALEPPALSGMTMLYSADASLAAKPERPSIRDALL
jgi:hypothetical protein